MPMNRLARLLFTLAVLAASAATGAFAAQADRDQPIRVEADAMRYDDVHQTSVFTGNVVVTKGSIVLRAGRVDLRQAPDGYQYATAIAAAGKAATFRERLDSPPGQPDQFMEGSAQRIEYDGKTGVVTLRGQAVLSRLIGGRLADRSEGSVIAYNQITDVFNVDGGAQGVTPSNPNGRVRVMIAPQPATTASTPPASGGGSR